MDPRTDPAEKALIGTALEFCREDECVEVTPDNLRIRKVILDQNEPSKAAQTRNG